MRRGRERKRIRFGYPTGALLTVLVGLGLLRLGLGESLEHLSYDLPFRFRSEIAASEIIIVYIDAESKEKLGQTADGRLERRRHVELLRRLTRERAALIVYDVVFEKDDPQVDPDFAQAMRDHGRVVVGDVLEDTTRRAGTTAITRKTRLISTNPTLKNSATGWGLLMVPSPDAGLATRRIFSGDREQEAAIWVAAKLAGARETLEKRLAERWLNFYGPTYAFDAVSFREAIEPDAVPADFFRDKMVFIGGHPRDLTTPGEPDKFATPYTRFTHTFSPGVEMLATAFLNLKRNDWLKQMSLTVQIVIVIGWGLLAGMGLLRLRPWHAAWVALVSALAIAAISFYLQWHHRLWWSWLVPAAAQTSVALVWSLGYQYAVEARQRRKLFQAFSAYLSPHLADRIARSDADLTLGGKVVETTILFTDLEGFTNMADTLPAVEISRILTAYFNEITRQILEREGTIIKYIGDAVLAVWGAPLEDTQQAERAVLAACGIIAAVKKEIAGRRLRTRIGINSGPALVGNLGSDFRFDYTVLGTAPNLASRLEELNKRLDTDILISDATRRQLSPSIKVRYLGRFLVKGIADPVTIYEVLEFDESQAVEPAWMAPFAEALELISRREFDRAEVRLRQVIDQRGGRDGPAEFFLREIATLRTSLRPQDPWDGVIR